MHMAFATEWLFQIVGDRPMDTLDKTVAFLAKRDGTDKVNECIL